MHSPIQSDFLAPFFQNRRNALVQLYSDKPHVVTAQNGYQNAPHALMQVTLPIVQSFDSMKKRHPPHLNVCLG